MQQKNLAPWEVPPDESYWHALLQEEDGQESTILALTVDREGVDEHPEAADAAPVLPAADAASSLETLPSHMPTGAVPTATQEDQESVTATPVAQLDSTDAPPEPDRQPAESHASQTDLSPPEPHPPAINDADSWQLFCRHRDADTEVELRVEGYNRGGLLVRWEEIVGFVPASQLCDGLRYGDEQTRLKELSTRVGSVLTLKVIEVDPAQNRLILSERAARHVSDPDLGVLDELNPGDICRGEVTNLCTFGAFVDLGGVEGLIHISELSWGRVAHPADILSSGQQVEVYVLNVDRDQGRVGLSLKRLQSDPWSSVDERYYVNQVVEGQITNIVNFGAFVRLEEGLEGLIHTSELSGALLSSIGALREGVRVLVRINNIESERHRIGLSLANDSSFEVERP